MFERTKKEIERFYHEGIYKGYITTFIDHEQLESIVQGEAAIYPEHEKLTKDHYFDLASLTKVIGTVSVYLRLLEQKRIQLDQKLVEYLPEYQDKTVTIRQLLTHTSGINTWIENRDQLSPEALREAYLVQKSGKMQSKEMKYTDTGFILLGMALERYFELPLDKVFQQELFAPLKINEIRYGPISQPQAVATEKIGTTVLKGEIHDPKARILGQAGHAGLFATNAALIKFVREYLAPVPTVYQARTLDALAQDHTAHQLNRSLGWELKTIGTRSVLFHTGYTGTFILIDRVKQRGWIFLSNRVHPDDHREAYIAKRDRLIQLYLEESEKEDQKQM